jgi:acetyl esterase/lipase
MARYGLGDFTNGMGQERGYCVATDPVGDQAAGDLAFEMDAVGANSSGGSITWTAGTGKYAGITGVKFECDKRPGRRWRESCGSAPVGRSMSSLAPSAARDRWDPITVTCFRDRADLMGLPPLLIQVSSEEPLFDDSVWIAARGRPAELLGTLEVWPHMIDAWQFSISNLRRDAEPLPREQR